MSSGPGFVAQPCKAYRNFQIVYTVLTLNFLIPAVIYTFAPQLAIDGFLQVNALLGGARYPFAEDSSQLWRILAAANVATLACMCFALQLDLRRLYAVLLPLGFMKAYAALGLLGLFVTYPDVPLFGAGAVLDGVTLAVILTFARAAHRAVAQVPDADLVPRPLGAR